MTMTKKDQKLEEIKQRIVEDKLCPELVAGSKQQVFGDGNSDADILFIGEAPGKNEDATGLPFVGAAGKFLNEMLETIGLKRSDIYITNIVKYRPPDNRDPLPQEKAAFLPYLRKQIEIIKPKLIVTLGRHSMECFLPSLKISQAHGQPKRIHVKRLGSVGRPHARTMQGDDEAHTEEYEKYAEGALESSTQQSSAKLDSASSSAGRQGELVWVILPLYHPAAALYNGAMRQTLIDDFGKIPLILETI